MVIFSTPQTGVGQFRFVMAQTSRSLDSFSITSESGLPGGMPVRHRHATVSTAPASFVGRFRWRNPTVSVGTGLEMSRAGASRDPWIVCIN